MDILRDIKERLSGKILGVVEHSPKRVYITIDKKDIVEVAKALFFDLKARFSTAIGTDTPQGMDLLYCFSHDQSGVMIGVRVLITDKNNPEIDSIGKYIKAADWIEREMKELFGVNFIGHPNLTHLLLVDDWQEGDYPMRHDRKGKKQ